VPVVVVVVAVVAVAVVGQSPRTLGGWGRGG